MDRLVAIDPLALVLRSDVYVKLHLPDPAPPEVLRADMREMVKAMSADERRQALARARALVAYASALEKELAGSARVTRVK